MWPQRAQSRRHQMRHRFVALHKVGQADLYALVSISKRCSMHAKFPRRIMRCRPPPRCRRRLPAAHEPPPKTAPETRGW